MEQDLETERGQKKENLYVALVASNEEDVKDKGKAHVEDSNKLVNDDSS